ncbi:MULTISPECIES: hypothetical protein [unclassified Shewanella]|uniref:hypothetical protein n=1 Tax=unclassified Shewanella TaxID=196818 RepID=UPI001BBB7126|nr:MULTISPECIES: hypothetical protein [unclassified Shewanella]GIU12229.1 hypothetical protein TUM4444_19390 [Shewanella sp. MBTL60-112-B1]GIU31594.1 hypothetical protein TUM4445_16220 [Shewanella sp. MBTL60-112-B2]
MSDFAEFFFMTDDETILDTYRTKLVSLAAQFGLSEKQLEHRSYRSLQAGK